MEDKIIRLTGKTLKAKNTLRDVAALEFAKRITDRQLELVWMAIRCQRTVPFSLESGPWLCVQPVVHMDELLDKNSPSFIAESEISARWVHADRDRDFSIEVLDESPYIGDCKYTYRYRNLPYSVSNKPWYVQGQDVLGGIGILEWCRDETDAQQRMSIMSTFPQFSNLSIGEHVGGPGMNPLIAQALGRSAQSPSDLEVSAIVDNQNRL